ncbi:MAG: ATP-binding protein [Bacillota bacterium]|nr:ATP-binding protein [Bacillota bacterium]
MALYETHNDVPQVVALAADDCLSLIDDVCKKTLHASQERGGVIPLLALREIIENLLHASFRDVVVSVLPDGSVIVSDHGPGIPDKESALRPGFTTASRVLRRYIRGVGSGLTVAQESLRAIGGSLRLEDNLGGGTVVSLLVPQRHVICDETRVPAAPALVPVSAERPDNNPAGEKTAAGGADAHSAAPEGTPSLKGEYTKGQQRLKSRVKSRPAGPSAGGAGQALTPRQERLLRLFTELPEVGPSAAASAAGLSLASAYRELVALERSGLLEALPGGKRRLSSRGEDLLATLTKR